MSDSRAALVFGGTGYVGREVVRGLAREGIGVAFTYRNNTDVARVLETETRAKAYAASEQERQVPTMLASARNALVDRYRQNGTSSKTFL